jgi:hypothetical protein
MIANFFWNNKNLSIYEYACLKSFLKNNFQVHVYSYKNIKLPKKIKLKNASNILPKKYLYRFTHGGKKGCLAAFADLFRIHLQKKNLGWWFDSDVLCLKSSSEFYNLDKKKIIVGLETDKMINNAVLKINDQDLIDLILKKISNIGFNFSWGKIGPQLITEILKETGQLSMSMSRENFYPINFTNFENLLLPTYLKKARLLTKNSYTCHNYNQILSRFAIPKNIMPPKNSFLYFQFLKYCPELKNIETLPVNTLNRLLSKKNGFKENLKDLFPSFFRALKKI